MDRMGIDEHIVPAVLVVWVDQAAPQATVIVQVSPSLGALKFLYFHGDDSIWRVFFCFLNQWVQPPTTVDGWNPIPKQPPFGSKKKPDRK